MEHRYLRDETFQQLRVAIVGGALEPGAPLVIGDAAGMLGLSSMRVRRQPSRAMSFSPVVGLLGKGGTARRPAAS